MKTERKIRALVVDDEALSRQIVLEYLASHPEIEVIGECSNGFEAVKEITEQDPDLVFLDIQMPKLNGFEVLQLIDKKPAVVFITAYDQYALKAFEVHAVDYLLKPFSQQRFDEALKQAKAGFIPRSFPRLPEPATLTQSGEPILERLLVREGPQVHVLPVETVDYVEAQDDYIQIQAAGRSYLKQMTLSELETQLDRKRFLRIHRSYILNIERLTKIELYAKDSRVVILKDGKRLPVSRSGYEKIKKLL